MPVQIEAPRLFEDRPGLDDQIFGRLADFADRLTIVIFQVILSRSHGDGERAEIDYGIYIIDPDQSGSDAVRGYRVNGDTRDEVVHKLQELIVALGTRAPRMNWLRLSALPKG